MKLIKAHVTNYRSIEDSNEFEIGDLTCLVGKNEAGKTGILSALRGMHPFDEFSYDKINDYPRRYLSKYDERHKDTGSTSVVAKCWWKLEEADTKAARALFGPKCISSDVFTSEHGFGYDHWKWSLSINHRACLDHLIRTHGLEDIEKEALKGATDCATAIAAIKALPQKSDKLAALLKQLEGFKGGGVLGSHHWPHDYSQVLLHVALHQDVREDLCQQTQSRQVSRQDSARRQDFSGFP